MNQPGYWLRLWGFGGQIYWSFVLERFFSFRMSHVDVEEAECFFGHRTSKSDLPRYSVEVPAGATAFAPGNVPDRY